MNRHPGKTLLELVMPHSRWEDQTPETQSRWTSIACNVIATDNRGDFRNPESIGDACKVIHEQRELIAKLERRHPAPLEYFAAKADAERLAKENRRLRISQLRRMADACKALFSRAKETSERRAPEFPPAERIIAINARIRRFRAACLAEIERLRGEG